MNVWLTDLLPDARARRVARAPLPSPRRKALAGPLPATALRLAFVLTVVTGCTVLVAAPATRPGGADAAAAEQLRGLWGAFGSDDYAEADRAVAAMTKLGDSAVAFLAGRFDPTRIDAGRVRRLIADMGSVRYAVRKKASGELTGLGRAALPALEEALKHAKLSSEVRARADEAVKHWTRPPPGDVQARRIAAAQRVLAGIGTDRSGQLLARLEREGWLPWGEAVEGVQCRLRVERSVWPGGTWPLLWADFRNRGQGEASMGLWPRSWDIQCDGLWYQAAARFSGGVMKFEVRPGGRRNNIGVQMTPRWRWRSKQGSKPLAFEPGKHTLRVAFKMDLAGLGQCVVVSNPIVIEIVPGGKAPATQPAKLRAAVSLVSADEPAQTCRWRIERKMRARLVYGVVKGLARGQEPPKRLLAAYDGKVEKTCKFLTLRLSRKDGKLRMTIADEYAPPDSGGKGSCSHSVSCPAGAELVSAWRKQPATGTETKYLVLWQGRFVRDAKTLSTMSFIVRLAGQDDPIVHIFGKGDQVEASEPLPARDRHQRARESHPPKPGEGGSASKRPESSSATAPPPSPRSTPRRTRSRPSKRW